MGHIPLPSLLFGDIDIGKSIILLDDCWKFQPLSLTTNVVNILFVLGAANDLLLKLST